MYHDRTKPLRMFQKYKAENKAIHYWITSKDTKEPNQKTQETVTPFKKQNYLNNSIIENSYNRIKSPGVSR